MSVRRVVVISGMSGAGKTSALRAFEDAGYYCVDNLPPPLIETFLDLFRQTTPPTERVAIAVDARSGEFLGSFAAIWDRTCETAPSAQLVFFDANDAVLGQRFSETRRPHPLAPRGSVAEGIAAERELLTPLRELSDEVVDTSDFNVHALRDLILKRFDDDGCRRRMSVAVQSFSYRHGIPDNVDLVFDVRFLPNPHYDPALRPLTGLDKPVRDFIDARPETQHFLDHVMRLLDFLLPEYEREGKAYLTVAFGCTGGRHRSVTVASAVAEALSNRDHATTLKHIDLGGARAPRGEGDER